MLKQHFSEDTKFEKYYFKLRDSEGRILPISQIKALPNIPASHSLSAEWKLRVRSSKRLVEYIKGQDNISVLDIGCGNGWFINKIAGFTGRVTGIDINRAELLQAEELLKEFSNVDLIYGDLFELSIKEKYDIVLLNASVQYFADLKKLIERLNAISKPAAELHIVDSPIYRMRSIAKGAGERSRNYYISKGFAEMNEYYHHHSFEDLSDYEFVVLYDPGTLVNKVKRKLLNDSPFPWIKIKL